MSNYSTHTCSVRNHLDLYTRHIGGQVVFHFYFTSPETFVPGIESKRRPTQGTADTPRKKIIILSQFEIMHFLLSFAMKTEMIRRVGKTHFFYDMTQV